VIGLWESVQSCFLMALIAMNTCLLLLVSMSPRLARRLRAAVTSLQPGRHTPLIILAQFLRRATGGACAVTGQVALIARLDCRSWSGPLARFKGDRPPV
jgi:hypothetical protein